MQLSGMICVCNGRGWFAYYPGLFYYFPDTVLDRIHGAWAGILQLLGPW